MDVRNYHNKEKSHNQLLSIKISLTPKKDGKLMEITNKLIREGWELIYIKEIEGNPIISQTHEFTFHRYIDV